MTRNLLIPALSIVASALLAQGIASGADPSSPKTTVLAEMNGAKLTAADLERTRPSALFQARVTYYEAERRALDDYIDEFLLEQQAKKETLTVPQLLERHVNSTIGKDPSEETLRVYYEGVETTEPYEAVRDKIVDALRQRRIAKAKTAYMQSLRSQADVNIRLEPPRAQISMKDIPVRGPSSARVTLLKYADYECPYCQQIQPAVDKLEAEYKGKLLFAYKDFPLSMHANAQKAAEATHCAAVQGKYWEYHDTLGKTKQLDPAALRNHARELKLDTNAFDQCLDRGEKADAVKAQASEAQTMGLQGTPTFFVNGRYVSGTPSYDRLRAVIEEELKMVEQRSTPSSGEGATRSGEQLR